MVLDLVLLWLRAFRDIGAFSELLDSAAASKRSASLSPASARRAQPLSSGGIRLLLPLAPLDYAERRAAATTSKRGGCCQEDPFKVSGVSNRS